MNISMSGTITAPIEDAEEPYILKTWLMNVKGHHKSLYVRDKVFFDCIHPFVHARMKDTPLVKIIYEDVPDEILGWACGERVGATRTFVIYYCYVKAVYRGHGLARRLIGALGHIPGDPLVNGVIGAKITAERMAKHNIENNPYLFFKKGL